MLNREDSGSMQVESSRLKAKKNDSIILYPMKLYFHFTEAIPLTKRVAVEGTVIPTNCRNSDTSNYPI